MPIRDLKPARLFHCTRAGFETIVSVPIRLQDRLMGELDLFYHAQIEVSAAARSWLEALTVQVARGNGEPATQSAGAGNRCLSSAQFSGASIA